jgi:putative transposase
MSALALQQQSYRFQLAPNRAQEELLTSFAGASRFFFNWGLALVKMRLDLRAQLGPSIAVPWSYTALCSEFAKHKDEIAPWRGEVVVGSQQAGLEALGRALQAFSSGRRGGRRVGFPRFRVKGQCKESVIFQYPRIQDARNVSLDRRLGPIRSKEKLSKLIRLLQRDPRARIRRSTIARARSGKWFISFTVERSPKERSARRPQRAVGVDLGLTHLATLSTGQRIENFRPLRASTRKLRRAQRQLDRQRRANNPGNYDELGRARHGVREWHGSNRMTRTRVRIARLHERVANLRREQAHQFTTRLTREYGVIGVETLNVRGLLQNKRLARHIADAGWGLVLSQLAYKTSWAASMLVPAESFYPSSKRCSACGAVRAKLPLSERVFRCKDPECGLVLDRDLNAALNLAHLARDQACAEGFKCHVARIGRETENARGGLIRPEGPARRQRPVKREGFAGPKNSTQARESLAVAA